MTKKISFVGRIFKNVYENKFVKEMIGRETEDEGTIVHSITAGWASVTGDVSQDTSRPIYALNKAIYKGSIVKTKEGKPYGKDYIYGASFGKPIVNAAAAFAFAGLTPPRVEIEHEVGDELNRFLYRNRKKVFDFMRFGFRDGDSYIRLNVKDGEPLLELIDPDLVTVISADDDVNTVLGYDIEYIVKDKKGKKKVIIEKFRDVAPYYQRIVIDGKNETVVDEDNEDLPFLRIVHYANEKEPNSLYGTSDYQNVYYLMKAYSALMDNSLKGAVFNSTPTPKFTGIKNFDEFLKQNFDKKPDGEYEVEWKPGDILMFGEDGNVDFMSYPNFIDGASKMLEYVFYCIVQASETPEFAMGTAVASSKASVSEQLPVLVNKAHRKRGDFEDALYALLDLYLNYLATSLKYKPEVLELDYNISWPEIISEDKKVNVEIVKTLKELGLISDETALALADVEVENIDDELARAGEQEAKKTAKSDIYSAQNPQNPANKDEEIQEVIKKDNYKSKRTVAKKKVTK